MLRMPHMRRLTRSLAGASVVRICRSGRTAVWSWRTRGRADYAVAIAAAWPRPSSSTASSRILNFCTLPVTVIGNESTNFT
jgi:hypothetical protein